MYLIFWRTTGVWEYLDQRQSLEEGKSLLGVLFYILSQRDEETTNHCLFECNAAFRLWSPFGTILCCRMSYTMIFEKLFLQIANYVNLFLLCWFLEHYYYLENKVAHMVAPCWRVWTPHPIKDLDRCLVHLPGPTVVQSPSVFQASILPHSRLGVGQVKVDDW